MEIWKPVVGYEGLYEVSNKGCLKRLKRRITRKGRGSYFNKELKSYGSNNGNGYLRATLTDKRGVKKQYYMHRLVSIGFINNPKRFRFVNHKDEDKHNNCVENLEWCTQEYNNNYGTANDRMKATKSNEIARLDLSSGMIEFYAMVSDLPKKYKRGSVYKCLCGVFDKHMDSKWFFTKNIGGALNVTK